MQPTGAQQRLTAHVITRACFPQNDQTRIQETAAIFRTQIASISNAASPAGLPFDPGG